MSITIEPTRDPGLLRQYYRLRERSYREELGLPAFDGSEEIQDKLGCVLLAHDRGRCVGGARIVPAFCALDGLGELPVAAAVGCAWERFTLDPDIRTVQLATDFCAGLIEHSRYLGYRHAVVLSSLRNARFYRRCHSALGMDFDIVCDLGDSAGGRFGDLEHYLSVSRLDSFQPGLQQAA